MGKDKKLNAARELAGRLFDLKLTELEAMSADQKKTWMSQYNLLTEKEFEDVRRQVLEAKLSQQSQIGWQSIPHDIAVLVFCLVSIFFSLKLGLVYGVAVLTMLISLTLVYFNAALYKILGYAVWLTYPAYIWLGFTLFRRGLPWWQVLGVIALAWGGTFLLQALITLPLQMFLRARAQSNKAEKNRK